MIESALAGQDAFAEQVEVGAAVHLLLDRFDAVDVAFYRAGAVRQCESIADRVVVAADSAYEAMQVGQVVGTADLRRWLRS